MAGVVVVMAVMAIMLTVAVQSATFHKQREKEMELIFRGEQFAEGVRLFRARNGRFPLTLDELVKAKPRAMRKKWLDPVTGEFDWVPVFLGQGGQGGQIDTRAGAGAQATPAPTPAPTPFGSEAGGGKDEEAQQFPKSDAHGPIIGVHSRSRDKANREYHGRSRYCDWLFTLEQPQQGQGRQGQRPPPTPRP